ncbi:MAG: dihydrodipicolinate synthase family protein [Chloroflexota bacterium]|nr:MAG: dihydrodipicolinate synthase family protein [Chloroflexota bacterium]
MSALHPFSGVYAAAVTPLKPDFSPDLDAIQPLLEILARRGCHGALLMGTTGEGPSFSPEERFTLWRSATQARTGLPPGFRLLAGTGTPSLDETVTLTRYAFDLGMDGVVVLPPYYFRKATEEGLFLWFSEVIRRAVPAGGKILFYDIPTVSGVSISLDLLARLKDAFPDRFAGLKDSSASQNQAQALGRRFGHDMLILNGTDRLFTEALQAGASGCITALANLVSPDLRKVWESFLLGAPDLEAQTHLNSARDVSERYQPVAPLLKGLLALRFGFPLWAVKPPLLPSPVETVELALRELEAAGSLS